MITQMASKFPTRPVGIVFGTVNNPLTVVEVFVDLLCPFSKRMWDVLYKEEVMEQYSESIQFRWYNTPQPWHFQSTFAHSCVLAMSKVNDDLTKDYLASLFDHQEQFFDENTHHKCKADILDEMAELGAELGVDKQDIISWATMDADNNDGRTVAPALKLCVKYHRARGVHVTPTVFLNGLEAGDISSQWTSDQWRELLDAFMETQGDGTCYSCMQI